MIWLLLIIFQIKHFLADYPLQNTYMLGKFKDGYKWVLPLLTHSLVHALFTSVITLIFTGNLNLSIILGIFDLTVHTIVDRIKASPKMLGRFKALTAKDYPTATDEQKKGNTYFWWALGADQFAHHVTHYVIIYLILQGMN